jgi:hypothetical protein
MDFVTLFLFIFVVPGVFLTAHLVSHWVYVFAPIVKMIAV